PNGSTLLPYTTLFRSCPADAEPWPPPGCLPLEAEPARSSSDAEGSSSGVGSGGFRGWMSAGASAWGRSPGSGWSVVFWGSTVPPDLGSPLDAAGLGLFSPYGPTWSYGSEERGCAATVGRTARSGLDTTAKAAATAITVPAPVAATSRFLPHRRPSRRAGPWAGAVRAMAAR